MLQLRFLLKLVEAGVEDVLVNSPRLLTPMTGIRKRNGLRPTLSEDFASVISSFFITLVAYVGALARNLIGSHQTSNVLMSPFL